MQKEIPLADFKSDSILFYLCSDSRSVKRPDFITLQPKPYNLLAEKGMKKFEIKKISEDSWIVTHNEPPKFTCRFEDKKFNYSRTLTGLSDPTGDSKQIQLLEKMEKWLKEYHKEKTDD